MCVGVAHNKQAIRVRVIINEAESQQQPASWSAVTLWASVVGLPYAFDGAQPDHQVEHNATNARQNIPLWPTILRILQIIATEPVGEAGTLVPCDNTCVQPYFMSLRCCWASYLMARFHSPAINKGFISDFTDNEDTWP